MKFLIISDYGDFNGSALRLVKEGNDVRIYFKTPRARKMMKGLIEQVATSSEGLMWGPDVVVFDAPGQGKLADGMRQSGWKVTGGGTIQDELELDSTFATGAMEAFGISMPKTFSFPSLSDAAKFVLSHRRTLVFKTSETTFVPQTNDELLNFISHRKKVENLEGQCRLQEFVPGTDLSTQVYYAQGLPVAYPLGSIHLDDASIAWAYPTREPRAVQKSLKKISMLLEKKKYTGPLRIDGIVNKGKFYGLEFRTGVCDVFIPLLGEDLGSMLYRLAMGETKPIRYNEGFSSSLCLSLPPYPFSNADATLYESTRDYHVDGAQKNAWGQTIFPHDVYAKPSGIFTAGFNGVIAEIVGVGPTPYDACNQAKATFAQIELPHKQAKLSGVANAAERKLSELAQMNYDVPSAFAIPVEKATVTLDKPKPLGVPNEKKSVPVPAHMASTTLSMPTKYS